MTRLVATVIIGLVGGLTMSLVRPPSSSLVFSILGGVFASVAFEIVLLAINWADYYLNRRSLVAAFGPDVLGGHFTLAYASFRTSKAALAALTAAKLGMPHVAMDDDPNNPSAMFRVDEAVAAHDLRALTYLATHLTRNGAKPLIRRAADIVQPFDLSFVAFGLGGSQKARQLLDQLIPFGIQATNTTGGWLDLHHTNGGVLLAQAKHGEVIGYVIRLNPKEFPTRTWLLCAGPGPEGTVAAGFFLSRHFDRINTLNASDSKRIGKRSCVVVLRSKPGFEESAIADPPIPLQ